MVTKNFSEKGNKNKPGAILSGNLHTKTIKLKQRKKLGIINLRQLTSNNF